MTAARTRAEQFGMTPRSRQMLAFIVERERAGKSWTYEQAMQRLGLHSKQRPHALVSGLVDRGYVVRANRRVIVLPAGFAACPVVPARALTLALRPAIKPSHWPYLSHRTQQEIMDAEGLR